MRQVPAKVHQAHHHFATAVELDAAIATLSYRRDDHRKKGHALLVEAIEELTTSPPSAAEIAPDSTVHIGPAS